MAKRRTLTAPSPEELEAFEAEISSETRARPSAPIAHVAGEAALATETQSPEVRAESAKYRADAERLRAAEESGLLLAEVPIAEIDADAMVRDRAVLKEDEMLELRLSIAKNGLRMPLEVFELAEPREGRRYGLLSGYRRLMACRGLVELGRDELRSVKCFVRQSESVDKAYVAMVEENEIRSALSHYERGRIAVIAAGQGAFANAEEAVNRLFESASKAKRSKVRSFAQIFEDLGDMLSFPETLTEKRGLAVATALRAGAERRFRDVLGNNDAATPSEEWVLLEAVIQETADTPRNVQKGGRPKLSVPPAGWHGDDVLQTSSGFTIRRETDSRGLVIRIEGRHIDSALSQGLMDELGRLLEKPK